MNTKKIFGYGTFAVMLTLAFAALSLTGCENDPPIPQTVTYVSKDSDGNQYTLVITENTNRSGRYAAQEGDKFTFTVELFNNGTYSLALTYSGTIESSTPKGGTTEVEIKITVNDKKLTITISGTIMTVISGEIVDEDGETVVNTPETLNPVDKTTTQITVTGNTLAEKLQWIKDNAQSNADYTIEVSANESIAPHELSYTGKSDIKIILRGSGSAREISLSETGRLFIVESGVTLVLDNNITLKGRSDNTVSLVRVHKDGALIMNAGAKITGNTASYGGGVEVSNGTFTMSGGEISDNTASIDGGGVNVSNEGTFTMSGGEISGNTAKSNSESAGGGGVLVYQGTFTMSGTAKISGNTAESDSWADGGGVSIYEGTFTMQGGEISDNTAKSNSDSAGGGGVNVGEGATFTMSGGEISGNTVTSDSWAAGGGVYVYNGTFTMSGGEISGNTASSGGGGVNVEGKDAIFTMQGGKITGNTASSDSWAEGGGVRIFQGTFTMNGGEISGNIAYGSGLGSGGGGVSIYEGTFRIVNGTIYGSDEGVLSNTADEWNGHALRNYESGIAQHGTFSGSTWTSKGDLTTTENTIKVVNGELE